MTAREIWGKVRAWLQEQGHWLLVLGIGIGFFVRGCVKL